MNRVVWVSRDADVARVYVDGRYAGLVERLRSGWCADTRDECLPGRWRRRCEAKRELERVLACGAKPIDAGYVHARALWWRCDGPLFDDMRAKWQRAVLRARRYGGRKAARARAEVATCDFQGKRRSGRANVLRRIARRMVPRSATYAVMAF